ncbi:MAG: hypothetical protein PHV59_09300 [Victivallales bacterium]|nr:hypothetical protein [Victivallales bacterium]
MSEFKWTIEYTLALTYPAFMYLSKLLARLRADAAIDGVFAGYTAGKYGGKTADRLFGTRGDFYINRQPGPRVTEADIERAMERAKQEAGKYRKNV